MLHVVKPYTKSKGKYVMVWQHTRSTLRAQLLRRRWKGGLMGGVSEARVAVAMSSKLSRGIRR
jgi:hypothetical protein